MTLGRCLISLDLSTLIYRIIIIIPKLQGCSENACALVNKEIGPEKAFNPYEMVYNNIVMMIVTPLSYYLVMDDIGQK